MLQRPGDPPVGAERVRHQDGRGLAVSADLELFRQGHQLIARRDGCDVLDLLRVADAHDPTMLRARCHREERAVRVPAREVERRPRDGEATTIAGLEIEERQLHTSKEPLGLRQLAPVWRQRAVAGVASHRPACSLPPARSRPGIPVDRDHFLSRALHQEAGCRAPAGAEELAEAARPAQRFDRTAGKREAEELTIGEFPAKGGLEERNRALAPWEPTKEDGLSDDGERHLRGRPEAHGFDRAIGAQTQDAQVPLYAGAEDQQPGRSPARGGKIGDSTRGDPARVSRRIEGDQPQLLEVGRGGEEDALRGYGQAGQLMVFGSVVTNELRRLAAPGRKEQLDDHGILVSPRPARERILGQPFQVLAEAMRYDRQGARPGGQDLDPGSLPGPHPESNAGAVWRPEATVEDLARPGRGDALDGPGRIHPPDARETEVAEQDASVGSDIEEDAWFQRRRRG